MDLFANTNIDFMKYRKYWVWVSVAVMLIGLVGFFFHGKLNFGIEFVGGTQLTLGFREPMDPERLRPAFEAAGIPAQIQRFGEEGSNQLLVKVAATEEAEAAGSDAMIAVVQKVVGATVDPNQLDLNRVGADALAERLAAIDPDGVGSQGPEAALSHYQTIAQAVSNQRKQLGLFSSLDQVAAVPGVSAAVASSLRGIATVGPIAVLAVDQVSSQVGNEIRTRGTLAVILALLGMLAYIWFRFELEFGIGALMAALHDVLVTLGLFILFNFEFNLTTIAAFLTLVGYSVNDTVVVFDRVRENLGKNRGANLLPVLNESINQTLSRTVLTAGTTFLSAIALYLFGGDVMKGFAFVMSVGVVVGTYSSIYIASPFALLWTQVMEKRAAAKKAAGRPAGARA